MSFNDKQIKLLKEPLLAEDIKTREAFGSGKLSYIEGWKAIEEANRIFGFDSWKTEILTLKEVNRATYIKPPFKSGEKEKPMVSIAYMCTLRLTVMTGGAESVHEDVGFGDGVAGDTPNGMHSCIELASKEAVTDATKRCLRKYGNKFGLTLYEKDGTAPIDSATYDASKVIDAEALQKLRDLIKLRGVDDEWALTWLSAEGFTEPLEDLRQDWFDSLYKAVDGNGREGRDKDEYIAKFDNLVKLMEESVNMNMLKATFSDAWKICTKFEDKKRQADCQKIYEKVKVKFEDKK